MSIFWTYYKRKWGTKMMMNMTYDMLPNVRVITCEVSSTLHNFIMFLFPKLSSCCKEVEDNFSTDKNMKS